METGFIHITRNATTLVRKELAMYGLIIDVVSFLLWTSDRRQVFGGFPSGQEDCLYLELSLRKEYADCA